MICARATTTTTTAATSRLAYDAMNDAAPIRATVVLPFLPLRSRRWDTSAGQTKKQDVIATSVVVTGCHSVVTRTRPNSFDDQNGGNTRPQMNAHQGDDNEDHSIVSCRPDEQTDRHPMAMAMAMAMEFIAIASRSMEREKDFPERNLSRSTHQSSSCQRATKSIRSPDAHHWTTFVNDTPREERERQRQ